MKYGQIREVKKNSAQKGAPDICQKKNETLLIDRGRAGWVLPCLFLQGL